MLQLVSLYFWWNHRDSSLLNDGVKSGPDRLWCEAHNKFSSVYAVLLDRRQFLFYRRCVAPRVVSKSSHYRIWPPSFDLSSIINLYKCYSIRLIEHCYLIRALDSSSQLLCTDHKK
jgi:hypothetical protein